ncbi:hypothetical protein LSM04_005070 [Trypanosoma melophagium]|uniref:uncharacterized protein n=1 Tax=Trypanosoma melophagium TaxID=715481 RepID=UPI003519F010|nr:hypothetical protein LSM04_005070 [Trypanosoma melophagium]
MNEFVETSSVGPIPLEELTSFSTLQLEEKNTDEGCLRRGDNGVLDYADSEPLVKGEEGVSIPYVFNSFVSSSGSSVLPTTEPLDRALVDIASRLAASAEAYEPELSDRTIAPPSM